MGYDDPCKNTLKETCVNTLKEVPQIDSHPNGSVCHTFYLSLTKGFTSKGTREEDRTIFQGQQETEVVVNCLTN